ncbi:MAG: imidazolonepropionase, partial [Rhodospirillales bacterium]|nr:imidazolonepropionase [Rhodospirillales bacterium]
MDYENTDILITDVHLATMEGSGDDLLGKVDDAALAVCAGNISWLGPISKLPSEIKNNAKQIIEADGRWITPGLVDCHSHVIYGGNRAGEFAMRLEGASYAEIARAGGGIVSTVSATRAASLDELLTQSLPRIDALINDGVTTLEIKSGYGLDCNTEWRMLRAARRVKSMRPVDVITSFLGAHA